MRWDGPHSQDTAAAPRGQGLLNQLLPAGPGACAEHPSCQEPPLLSPLFLELRAPETPSVLSALLSLPPFLFVFHPALST